MPIKDMEESPEGRWARATKPQESVEAIRKTLKTARDAKLNRLEEEAEAKRPSNFQDVQDAKKRVLEDKAYQDAKRPFAKGGMVRDGCAKRGKTKGRHI